MNKISRTRIARYVASQSKDGVISSKVIRDVASYLIESGRTRELQLVVRSIEDELAKLGLVIADTVSTEEITDAQKAEIKKLLRAEKLELRQNIDKTIIGGLRVDSPVGTIDFTVANRLRSLKRAKI